MNTSASLATRSAEFDDLEVITRTRSSHHTTRSPPSVVIDEVQAGSSKAFCSSVPPGSLAIPVDAQTIITCSTVKLVSPSRGK